MINSLSKTYSLQKDGITQSLLSLYMKCPRAFAIATHELSQPTKLAMEIGTFGHKMIEKKMQGFDKYKMDKIVTTEQFEQTRAYIKAIIPAYFTYYKNEDRLIKSELNEYLFDTSVSFVRFRGKIDSLFSTDKTGKLWIREIKFKSRISEDDLDTALGLDWQSLCYMLAIRLIQKRDPLGVVYDVIRYPTFKAGQKPKDIYESVIEGIRKEPDHWFKRWTTKFDELDVHAFHGEFVQKILELRDRTIWYRNNCSCLHGFKCEYINYCATGKTDGLIKKKLFSELEEK